MNHNYLLFYPQTFETFAQPSGLNERVVEFQLFKCGENVCRSFILLPQILPYAMVDERGLRTVCYGICSENSKNLLCGQLSACD